MSIRGYRYFASTLGLILSIAAAPARAAGGLDGGFGRDGVAMFTPDGTFVHEMASRAVLVMPDGRLVVGGSRNYVNQSPDPHQRASLVRFSRDGALDTGFGNDSHNPGMLVLPQVAPTAMQSVEAMKRLVDGSIVVAGTAFALGPTTGFVMKLDQDGVPDDRFGTQGVVTFPATQLHALDIDVRPDVTRFVVAGERVAGMDMRGVVICLDAHGVPDPGFGADASGEAVFAPRAAGDMHYISALAVDRAGRIVIAGAYASANAQEFSVARLDDRGNLDAEFADHGWRVFRMPGDASVYNGIKQLLLLPDRRLAFAGYRMDQADGPGIVLGRLDGHGAPDAAFGAAATPGYRLLDVAPAARYRYPTGLARQDDGKLLVSVSYAMEHDAPDPARQQFMAVRVDSAGQPDAGFGVGGIAQFDLAPTGGFGDSTALAVQEGRPILAGGILRDVSTRIVDLALVRLQGDGDGGGDRVFADGFQSPVAPRAIDYDDVAEGFLGESWVSAGVRYHDVNGVDGVFPNGSTFTADDIGAQLIVERAPYFYDDFPDWGSAPNALTFGDTFIGGDNFSIGPLARVSMDMDVPMSAAAVDLAYYENGQWGGIELHLEARRAGTLVGSDALTIADGNPGRDNPAVAHLAIRQVEFDSLRLHASFAGQPSAPRVMIDRLVLTPAR